ncbi:uracil permease [Alkalihalobacillus alcalophilus ATCC 27647 = CGMCC 1.3604]|uniref:Uracil permease n=1 Tax=Alkalihalobacillus alcalophilus ATCC 27647 = CGMCC 1.3604 TaxID=1218173 RepID=J8TPK9_ALKAL|nr:solute carrier family 23 protein [Alkalihalobacillus alcalophilus]AFV25625.1 xanthine/uracil transporter [Alkalihalobacillus alcalophilus ATCC 27647 = CGMCC 1.3604]KGA97759.1 uracil permease [Alkalihalobacillus alcalophilus ATCC 27647 = CGMCC 1.3604]MED1563133.1 solute carrier family 23 protein [Alkalihalobacillus alcalophilus]
MSQQKEVLGVRDVPRLDKWVILSLQHLFAMFGATILVPAIVGLSPSVALLSSGLGTLAYLIITRGQIPAYLGSSFAFISPIITATALGGPEGVMVGTFFAGIVYGIVALGVKRSGVKWLMNILPPAVVGPIIMVIGLGLSTTAIDMAMMIPGEDPNSSVYSLQHFTVALFTLAVTIVSNMFFKGFFGLIPILFGVVSGYLFASIQGLVDFTEVKSAAWLQAPDAMLPFITYTPNFSWAILFVMVPVAAVTLAEHIGDQMVLSKVTGKNFIEKPGLHRSILGDGVASIVAALVGGPPNTTYGENIGVLAMTRVFSVFVVGGAAVFAILFSFVGKISAIISSIPAAVMGGISILLFGIIASSGMRMLVENKVDFGVKRNLIIASTILVTGIGGAFLQFSEDFQIAGMAFATIIGVVLHLILPGKEAAFGENSQLFSNEELKEEK